MSYSSLAISKEQLIPRCPKLEILLAAPGNGPVFNGVAQSTSKATLCKFLPTPLLTNLDGGHYVSHSQSDEDSYGEDAPDLEEKFSTDAIGIFNYYCF